MDHRCPLKPAGLALGAIRDSEDAAESAGVDNARVKLAVYVIVAAATGMIAESTLRPFSPEGRRTG